MKSEINEEDEDNILYELLIHAEWALEPEIVGDHALSQGGSILYRTLKHTPNHLWLLGSNLLNSLWRRNSISPNLARVLNCGSEWQLGVGAQGAVIAILQDSSLEIRAKKDEYASVVGKNLNLYSDPFPKRRKVAWSLECSMVAVAYSSGAVEIFNTVGASLFTIYPPKFQEDKIQVDASRALASLIFSDVRTEKIKWAAELIMIDFLGNIRGYFVSPTEGYQESHSFSVHRLYPHGISAAVEIGSLIIVAGSCQFINDPSLRNNGLGHGLSIWRMLNDYPFYKQVPTIDEDEYVPPNRGLVSHLLKLDSSPLYDSIFRLCISPLGRQVAALHSSGGISIWDVPSLRKRKFWTLENQPGFDMQNYDLSMTKKNSKKEMAAMTSLKNHLVDVKWWTEKAVILARFSGAVTICSIHSLTNLLGESPEFFEGVPQISETYDRCFMGLEMERNLVKNHSRSLTSVADSSSSYELDDASLDDAELYDEAELSLVQKWKLLTLGVLFWITDAERFRPVNKRPKVIARTCRLLCLKSTTPTELFTRKIENEEYGEALALAQRYNLDCDLVYQQQWRKNPVTVATIQDYLTKIRKRSWVLAECLSRVPNDIDAARELILYGLRGTELDTLVGIADGTNNDEFLISDLSMEYEEDPNMDPEEIEKEAQEWAAKDLSLRRELLSKLDFHNLTKEQVEVVRARQMLLKYYDRLSSYEVMLGGPHVAAQRYDPDFYEKFRRQTEVEAAVEMARNCNWQGVEVLFTYHGEATLPHRLSILSNFPPTIGPFEYRSLLPECDLSGEVFEWEEDSLRDPDWCEDFLCRKAVGIDPDSGVALLYEENPQSVKFGDVELTAELVSDWYVMRAKEMERNSHFVDAALDLIKLARERNCPGLEELQDTFDTLEVLVYEVGLSDFSLEKFETLSDLDKLKLLMSTSTPDTQIQNIRQWGLPFLKNLEKKEVGLGRKLLQQFIISSSTQDLSLAFKTIQHSQQENPILSSPEEILRVALESIYTCEKENQLPRSFAILECLPVRDSKRDSKELSELHNLVDALEDHLSVTELLSSHGVLVTPSFIKKLENDEVQIKLLLTRLARTASRRDIPMMDQDWNKLLSDMLEMQQKVFSMVEPQICFEILTEALLTSGVKEYIDFAGELMNCSEGGSPVRNPYLQKLPFSTSLRLVIKASTEYFNSSESYLDQDMNLARYCLNMIDSKDEQIMAELDLIASLEILPDIGIHKLPLQVRLCEERLTLIVEALENKPENYRLGTQILRVAYLLRVCNEDERARKGKVTTLIAEAAFKAKDYEAASGWCLQLVKGGYGEGWKICALLGRCPEVRDFALKSKFLDFALTYCASEYLEELLYIRTEVELHLLYSRIGDRIDTSGGGGGGASNASIDSDDGFEDARAESGEESCEEFEDSVPETPPVSFATKRLLFSVTKNVLSVTAASTSSLVSTVASKRLWKNAVGWLRPLKGQTPRSSHKPENVDTVGNNDFGKQGIHAFYTDLAPHAHMSALGPSYKSFAPVSISSAPLEISVTLLRIALIEQNIHLSSTLPSNATVFQEVVKGMLKEDLLAGLAFLELLCSPYDVYQLFCDLPRTGISLQVSLYYYALQIYTSIHLSDPSDIPSVFSQSPNDIISDARTLVKSGIVTENDDIKAYIEFFQAADQMIEDYLQGQALHKLDAGIDIERFLNEPEYKKDTVLGLAMTVDPKVIDLSINLAKKYDVDLWDVHMTHLQHCFDSPDIDHNELQNHVRDRSLVSYLKRNPSKFLSVMEKDVLPTISGKDHEKLTYYFSLILEACEDDAALRESAKVHMNLLSEIKSVAPTLDYQILLTPNADTLEVLKPVLTVKNVDTLARIAQSLSKSEESHLESSMVYCTWAQKHFFTLKGRKKPKTTSDWIKRFEEIQEMLNKMKPNDILILMKNFSFSEEAISLVPVEARKEIIRKVVLHSKAERENAKESDSDDWKTVSHRLERLGEHLELLKSETFKKLECHSDERLRDYALQFMLSGGEGVALERLSQKILFDLSPFGVLQSVLAVYPEDVQLVPEDVFSQVLKITLSNLGKYSEGSDDEAENDFKVLSHILKELKKYCEDGGDLLDVEEVLEDIRAFARNEETLLPIRVRALSEAQKFFSLSEEDERLLQVMKTGGIVREAFSSPSKGKDASSPAPPTSSANNADTEEGRKELLQTLIDKMDSVKKAQSILSLLHIWPDFDGEMYSDVDSHPWLKVFLKLLSHSKLKSESGTFVDIIYSTTKQCLQDDKMPDEAVKLLVEKLLEFPSPPNTKCALKTSLIASHSASRKKAFEKLMSVHEITDEYYDEELFQLVVKGGCVEEILPTGLYGPFLTYLSEESNIEARKSVISQLEASKYWIEAASLSLFCSSIPRSLKTASSALKTFSKWM